MNRHRTASIHSQRDGNTVIIHIATPTDAIRLSAAEALNFARAVSRHAELIIARSDPLPCPWCNEMPLISEDELTVSCVNLRCPARPKTALTRWNSRA